MYTFLEILIHIMAVFGMIAFTLIPIVFIVIFINIIKHLWED